MLSSLYLQWLPFQKKNFGASRSDLLVKLVAGLRAPRRVFGLPPVIRLSESFSVAPAPP